MKNKSRGKSKSPASGARGNEGGNFQLKRILVPIDFSDYSRDALRYAVPFARQFQSELLLVYVVEPAIYPADFSFGQIAIPNFENELRERGGKELEQLIQEEIGDVVPARSVVRTGKPFLEIIEVASEEEVDLIITATHGHTGVEHLLFGGTAEKVVRKAPCPVLVVRPRQN